MPSTGPIATVIGFDHINIKSRDIQRSIDFYTKVIGLRLVRLDHNSAGEIRFAALRVGDALIDIQPNDSADWDADRTGLNHMALLIEPTNLAEIAERCRELGIPITEGPVARQGAYGMGQALYIQDPDGHGIELKHYEQPEGVSGA
jgi:catechol 2,3-dioxygenase-like lactoylglutathione lyase family enzyme